MHIYFSGIGGVGIGPLAMLAQDADYSVSGSDLQQSDMTNSLTKRGAEVQIGQDGSQITGVHAKKPIEWFVYSAALPLDHPELVFAREHGIKVSKRDEFLNHFLAEKDLQLVAVSGTHGKTTTTSMIVWLCNQLSVPVSYSVGAPLSFGPSAQYANNSKYFIYECDEFDKNFLSFKPVISAIPSMDYDHPDTYPTQSLYNQAFAQFVAQSGSVFLWSRVAATLGVASSERVSILDENDPALAGINLAGLHMRRNGLLAAQVAKSIIPDQPIETFTGLLREFPGSGRRFEKLADNIYTDYAHHPVEIAATIEMARELNKNVVVVYQPHQNVRQHEIIRESAYKNSFNGVKQLYWLPTYLSREDKNLAVLSATELLNSVNPDLQTEYHEMNDALWQKIKAHAERGDLVVAMSAGDLDGWLRTKTDY